MGFIVLNPTSGPVVTTLTMAARGKLLENSVIGFIDNGKKNSDTVLHYLANRLKEKFNVKETVINRKSSFSHGIDEREARVLAEKCDFIISGIGD